MQNRHILNTNWNCPVKPEWVLTPLLCMQSGLLAQVMLCWSLQVAAWAQIENAQKICSLINTYNFAGFVNPIWNFSADCTRKNFVVVQSSHTILPQRFRFLLVPKPWVGGIQALEKSVVSLIADGLYRATPSSVSCYRRTIVSVVKLENIPRGYATISRNWSSSNGGSIFLREKKLPTGKSIVTASRENHS